MFSLNYDKILDQLQPEEYEKNMKESSWFFRAFTVLGLIVVAISFIYNPDPDSVLSDVMFVLFVIVMCGMWGIIAVRSSARRVRKGIAKCLAGIECGQYHGVDDLIFYADIDRKLAIRIINGEFDFLMSSNEMCRYMP